ncbi:MAG: DUF1778 domain-containing protein [Rhodospirillales bacterium]|jgi:uncharacterized protein (DUF1778 family)|nr:DUF1778 domain-containing protein [Rhodospirillales bacterium]HIJ43378.1 DUF1778 domain-containing protein [Rhodospirillaceae bacterium]MDP7215277.1 DUF1778 domain-containing protein [Rhodospirillales bacterium]HIJ46083.1 DUF1778 domain-containing protein [Rhodospirillaceae bacterium]HIJ93322.1 DUF1778 domain-containing protein [Rhodospirillaceae bacterium]
MSQSAQCKERLSLRLDGQAKRKIERAAAYSNTSMTKFVLDSALSHADEVVQQHERITLSAEDWDIFYDALLNPPEPNEAMREGMKWYRDLPR